MNIVPDIKNTCIVTKYKWIWFILLKLKLSQLGNTDVKYFIS